MTWEIQCFGMTENEVEQEHTHYRRLYLESDPDEWSRSMFAMAILSDAQTMIEMDDHETARQYINKAKHHLGMIHAAHDPRGES